MVDCVFLAGPTASGKSEVAVLLCKKLNGEVVSADSMQLYKGMDIGTAKPTEAEMGGVPHHMLGVACVGEAMSAGRYATEARALIEKLFQRGKLPVVAGGTGLYFEALERGAISPPKQDAALRQKLWARAEEGGAQAVFDILKGLDPEGAEKIHPNNTKRVIRAIEVFQLTGQPIDKFNRSAPLEAWLRPVKLLICPEDRAELYRRIDRRVDKMLESGLVEEARRVFSSGLEGTAAQAIGYKELIPFFNGEATLLQAAESIKQSTRRYAKRQLTWFRRDGEYEWILYPEGSTARDIADRCERHINKKKERSE